MGQPLRGSSRANRAEVDPEARAVALCGNFVDDVDVIGLDVMPKSKMQKGMILHKQSIAILRLYTCYPPTEVALNKS
jgi:hypothetical protein